jgi:hypothetical protein
MVPVFIANGEIIRVDTAEKKYLGRETSGGTGPTASKSILQT